MFVRISTETGLLREATVRVTFFSISVGKKIRKFTEFEEERQEEEDGREEDAAMNGAAGSRIPFPFMRRVLLVQDGSVPF